MAMDIECFNCSRSNVRLAWGIFIGIWVIISGFLIGFSLQKLSSVEYGVEYDRWAKELDELAKQGGLHVGPPGFRFIKFPSTQITAENSDTCVSRDGLRVRYDVTYQYQMPIDYIVDAVEKYRDYKTWSQIVEYAGNSAIQHTCSEYNVTDFQTLRNVIQDRMFNNLKAKLEGQSMTVKEVDGQISPEELDIGVYALARSLQLRDVSLPTEYKDAVSSKQRAEEDIALARNQRQQETTRANTELRAAEKEAEKVIETAENNASVIQIEAERRAEEITFAFAKESEVLQEAAANFNLTPNGILAYMTNQLYASISDLKVQVGEPARISRKDLLSRDEL